MRLPAVLLSRSPLESPLKKAVSRSGVAGTQQSLVSDVPRLETSLPDATPALSSSGAAAVDAAPVVKAATGVAGWLQSYGPYALMGAFTSALGVGLYEIVQGTSEYIDKSGFPIKDWPNTASHLNHNHGAHDAPDAHAGHAHPPGPAGGGHAQHFGFNSESRQYFPLSDGQAYTGRMFHYDARLGDYVPCDPPSGLFRAPVIPKDGGLGWGRPPMEIPKK